MKHHFLPAAAMVLLLASTACNKPDTTLAAPETRTARSDSGAVSLKIAFIYGDSINDKYNFLIDAEDELEEERTRVEDRLRRKLAGAEQRAQELQRQAPSMSQMQMQEAQLELQGLDIEMQQFQEKLAGDLRKREIELQQEYLDRVDRYLEAYNQTAGYDVILNYQRGGNVLLIDKAFDITSDVLNGLNEQYANELKESAQEAK